MNTIQISITAKNYANALKDLAHDGSLSCEDILRNLNNVLEIYKTSNELQNVLNNPSIPDKTKYSIVEDVFTKDVDSKIVNFLKILIEKNRFKELQGIVESYRNELDNIKNIQRICVTSAIPLKDEFKKRIEEKLQNKLNKQIIADWNIDEEIIGGLVVKINDDVIDTSLKNKLENLSKNLI